MPETRKGSFCSDECEHESKVRSSPSYARRMVFERDGGICDLCGMDTESEQKRLESLERSDPERWKVERETLGIPDHRVTLWDMDHIVPVVEGGGQCGLGGYRTLCIWCHGEVTGDLNRKLAAARRDPRPTPRPRPPGITVITVARKPLSEGSVAENVLKWETGGLNIGGARLPSNGDHKRPYQPTNKSREVYGAQTGFQPTNADGRWPSNLVLSPAAAADLDAQSGPSKSRKGKPRKGASGPGWGMTHTGAEYDDSGGASRYFKQVKSDE